MNKLIYRGKLGADPELKYTPSGATLTTFTVANTRKFKDQSDTTWLTWTAWSRLAEVIVEHFGKGQEILIEGYLKESKWSDSKTGENRSRVEGVVENFEFVGPKKDRTAVPENDTEGTIQF